MPEPANPADDYPPHLKHLAPTQSDLDALTEVYTGKPVDKGTAARNVAALRQRIAELTELRTGLEQRLQAGGDVAHFITDCDRDLATARALLAGYELQLGKLN